MPRTLADPSPQLSLWADEATANDEGAETAPPDSPAACDPPALPRTAQPEVPRPAQPSAAPQPAPQPAAGAPIASVLLPATFRHPQANRESRLDGHHVAYLFRRMRRKTIGFSVGAEGLVVSAPRWVAAGEVDSALQEKSRWVLAKLQEQAERARKAAAQRIEWRDGATVPFLGEPVIVVLDPRVTGTQLVTATDTLPGVPRLTLHVGLTQHAGGEQIRDAVQSWLQRQARRVFEQRCHHFAAQLGVRWTRLSLSSATTRWGSASADGAIRLHWRLIHFALPTIDYVVAHELAHLRVMDHSPRFWDVVRSVIPDVEKVRDGLRDELLPG
jgi:predicted metal-dependent hydrolase